MSGYTDRHRTDDPPLCAVCGKPKYQKHLETCTGPPKGKPAPDYNPRVDHPERFMREGAWSI